MYTRCPSVGSHFSGLSGFVITIFTLAYAHFAAADDAADDTECGHGRLSADPLTPVGSSPNRALDDMRECVCDPHWQLSHRSDPANFAEHKCEQFMCESDAQCVDLLGIPDAECPVQGWNCDCGFSHAAFENDAAKCMYPWYAFAMKVKHSSYFLLVYVWIVFALGALLMLPFGQNTIGPREEYSCEIFFEDLAWTFWIVKVGVWTYLVIIALYLQVAIIWVSVLAFAIMAGFFAVAVGSICAYAGCESGGSFEAGSQCDWPCGTGCQHNCCDGCCEGCCSVPLDGSSPLDGYNPEYLYASSNSQPPSQSTCTACPFLRYLIPRFPKAPRNMLGGCIGHCMGTHSMADPEYYSTSPFQEFMSTSCFHLQRRGEAWQQFVQMFVLELDADNAMRQAGQSGGPARPEMGADGAIIIGGVVVEPQSGDFLNSSLRIYNANDYIENSCWICCEPRDKFDLWLTCRHIFCSQCSTEMLRRRMPCPLCRVHTTKVLRRASPDGAGASSGDELGFIQPQAASTAFRGLRQQAAPQEYTSVEHVSERLAPQQFTSMAAPGGQQLLQQPVYASMGQVATSDRQVRREVSQQAYGALPADFPRSNTGPPMVLSSMQVPPPSAGTPYTTRPSTQ